MHILYFHQYFTPRSGSFGTRSYEFATQLLRRGHQVTMVCGTHDRADLNLPLARKGVRTGHVNGISVIQFDLPYSNYDGFVKRSRTFLRFAFRNIGTALRHDFDLLFATSTPLTIAIPGMAMKCCRRKPFVFEVRDLWPDIPKEMNVVTNPMVLLLMTALERSAYWMADGLIGLSPGMSEGLVQRSRPKTPVTMIPNGCDLDVFTPAARGRLAIAGVRPGDTVAVFAGAHGLCNGLDAILDAALVLKRRARDQIKLLMIGDGREKPRLMRRAAECGLSNCLFLNPVPKTELSRILPSCDIGLMTLKNIPAFYRGTSPNKFFDYISAGLPVINNYPGWLADMIVKNECGLAVEPDDPEKLADALAELSNDAGLRLAMGKNARSLAEREFGREKLANAFVDWLETIYKAYHRGRAT